MVSAAGDFVFTKFFEINVVNHATFLLFSPSSVMILLPVFFLVSLFFFFVKDKIPSFELKQIIVFLN